MPALRAGDQAPPEEARVVSPLNKLDRAAWVAYLRKRYVAGTLGELLFPSRITDDALRRLSEDLDLPKNRRS